MGKVFVIDDDKDITEVVQIYLEELKHEVVCFSKAGDALEALKSTTVDLLITDILMPEMNGLELITSIKNASPSIKVLAMSGGGETGGIVKVMALETALELGAEGTLPKPFTQAELTMRVNKLLN